MAIKVLDPSTRHPEYNHHQAGVTRCYDAFNGDVRNEKYVARLTDQSDKDYMAYTGRPFYLNATERTIQSLIGVMTRVPPEVSGEVVVDGALDFAAMYQDAVMDVALGGRIMLTVDVYPDGSPYLTYYTSTNVINWSHDFVMLETMEYVRNPDNPYELECVTRWKELYLDEAGNHTARYWEKKGKAFVASEPVNLLAAGRPVKGLQVWWVTPYDNTDILYNPPVKSVAELNISHFKLSCDHYHGLHYLAVPTFTITGGLYPDESGNTSRRIILGSTSEALHLSDGASAQFVEFSGSGLGSIHSEKDRVEELMNQYGARLVSPKAGVESAEAVKLRADAENSILETMANALETGINAALVTYAALGGGTAQISVNRDFAEAPEQLSTQPTAEIQ